MPNDTYLRTHDGLAAMVSARVATRVLEQALAGNALSPERVAPEEMGSLLLGPVFRELETTLPREGLRRNLEALASGIRAKDDRGAGQTKKKPRASRTPEKRAAAPGARSGLASALILDHETAAAVAGQPRPEPPIAPLLREIEGELAGPAAGRENPEGGRPAATAAPTESKQPRILDANELERAVLGFAQIDHVTLVAVLDESGSVAMSRGSGLDLGALARYSHMGLRLLERRGRLRSYYLGHSRGQLFLLPVGKHSFIVVGTPDLNIGAVFTALTGLEEEV